MATSRFESAARARKVGELVATARARRVAAVDVASSDWVRRMLVAVTGVREPSDETWRQTVAMLDSLERCERADNVVDLLGRL